MKYLPIRRSRLALAMAALPGFVMAAPGTDSAYRTDAQSSHVEDATSRGINQVNMITCFTSAMRPDALVNKGDYIALVDKSKCDPQARSSTGNSGSDSAGSGAPSYMSAVLNATRATNNDPMRVRAWVDQAEEDFNATIFLNIAATEAPSASNPYGVFRLDYCGKGSAGPCMMRGFLEGSTTGISYFEIESDDGGGGGSSTKALRLTTSGTDRGAGSLQMSKMGQQEAFSFAYNADLFRRSDGTNDQCFSRDASDPDAARSVWRYGLYDAATGERVTRRSGFPIEYAAPDGKLYNGHMGYWGLWLPPEASSRITTGATVRRVEYASDPPTKTDHTLVKADGRLTKYTKRTRTLAATDKIKFQTFVWDVTGFFAGAVPQRQYEMYWDDMAGVFKVSGAVECGQSGCQSKDLASEKSVPASFFADQGGVRGWSQALGGEVFIPLAGVGDSVDSANVNVIYRVQDLVYPADMPAALFCLRDCPSAAAITGYFAAGSTSASPFVPSTFNNWRPTDAQDVVNYATDAAAALLKDADGASVVLTDRVALQTRPQYQGGVRTGRLFTTLADAQCAGDASRYCDNKVEELDVYYQWETGPNQWNQFAALKDSTGAIVAFDAPLQVTYAVPADARYGQYSGKSIVLQYGGFGQLSGIPGHCVSPDTNEQVSCDTPESRYVPAFVIPFDEVLGRVNNGSNAYLVKWLDREIRFARKDPSACAAAGVTLATGLTLPTADGLKDPSDPTSSIYIGEKPVATDAPRVIHGDVKY